MNPVRKILSVGSMVKEGSAERIPSEESVFYRVGPGEGEGMLREVLAIEGRSKEEDLVSGGIGER